jgi:hypothetical protein
MRPDRLPWCLAVAVFTRTPLLTCTPARVAETQFERQRPSRYARPVGRIAGVAILALALSGTAAAYFAPGLISVTV